MHLTLRFILNTMCNNETQLGWYELIATLTRTLLPRRWQNYSRKWCKWWPAEAKTLYAGSLMRVWLTMDQKWNQEQWSRRYWQHLRLQADASSSVRKKKKCGLIIWICVLLEPRLQPTWMFQKPHQTEMGGWTLIHVRLSFSDICLHSVSQMFPAWLLLIFRLAKGLHTCLSSQTRAGERPLGPIKHVYLKPHADSKLATRLNHIPNV